MLSVLWMGLALAAEPSECKPTHEAAVEVTRLYEEDLAARKAKTPVGEPEKARAAAVAEIAHEVCTPKELYKAASLLSYGEAEQLELGWGMARRSYEGGVAQGGKLFATLWDRWAVAQGGKQRYGTAKASKGGKLCLMPMDESVTDAQREALGLAPLAETLAAFLKASGAQGEPTRQTLSDQGLWCR